MEFTNASLEKVDEARKIVAEFTEEVLKRAKVWLEANFKGDFDLPAPHIIFEQEGWVVEIVDLDKVLNGTVGDSIQFRYCHPNLQRMYLPFEVPESAIFTESAKG